MEPIYYRNAEISDLEKIVDIYNSTVPSRMVTADTDPVTVESRISWFQEHIPEYRPLWIVENSQGNRVGWVSFQSFYGRPAYDTTAEISIYLESSYRSRGFGRKVLEYSLEKAPDYGLRNLLAYIFAHNEPSLKLFKSVGFEEWGSLPDIAVLDGMERTLKILGKRLLT